MKFPLLQDRSEARAKVWSLLGLPAAEHSLCAHPTHLPNHPRSPPAPVFTSCPGIPNPQRDIRQRHRSGCLIHSKATLRRRLLGNHTAKLFLLKPSPSPRAAPAARPLPLGSSLVPRERRSDVERAGG
ncbi:hypothetical protein Anapl_05216 [Anas platyrhynchos]|uniref:Uncharacterized protein n=1 Tax=Anas platyrhynchos TaxID=8839 RepID=R0JSW2_ANAPL|nr:hypothetical protein Anapl_05216 [Anas platyrhynchos]